MSAGKIPVTDVGRYGCPGDEMTVGRGPLVDASSDSDAREPTVTQREQRARLRRDRGIDVHVVRRHQGAVEVAEDVDRVILARGLGRRLSQHQGAVTGRPGPRAVAEQTRQRVVLRGDGDIATGRHAMRPNDGVNVRQDVALQRGHSVEKRIPVRRQRAVEVVPIRPLLRGAPVLERLDRPKTVLRRRHQAVISLALRAYGAQHPRLRR